MPEHRRRVFNDSTAGTGRGWNHTSASLSAEEEAAAPLAQRCRLSRAARPQALDSWQPLACIVLQQPLAVAHVV